MPTSRKLHGIILLLSMLCNLSLPTLVYSSEELEIPIGTNVILAFQNTINPATARVGEQIFLTAVSDVEVDGITVIEEGATAIGEITQSVEKGNVGKPAKIGVTLRSVEAVNGKNIPISGNKLLVGEDKQTNALVITILCCVLGLLMKGGEAELSQGSTVEGTVVANTKINI